MVIGKGYRQLLILVIIFTCPFLLQCITSNDEEENTCDDTVQPRIEPLLRIHLRADITPDSAYTGPAKFIIEKEYCNGNRSGRFTDSTESMINGYWKPITTQYIFQNDSDKVLVNVLIQGQSDLGNIYFYQEIASRSRYMDGELIFEDTLAWVFDVGP